MEKIRLDDKFGLIREWWRPKVAATLNGQDVRLVKLQGQFVWHSHAEADELFLCWRGRMTIEWREGGVERSVELGPGEMLVVPRGVEHRTSAAEECEALIFEPSETVNTGAVVDERFTAPRGVRV